MEAEEKTILLFDMDGVLLKPGGYHRALQDTVAHIAAALGFEDVCLLQEEIDLFEAVGVTSEWDSSAICTALMLRKVWEQFPGWQLPQDMLACTPPLHNLHPPDFQVFYRSLFQSQGQEGSALERAERLLLQNGRGYTPSQMSSIRSILREARSIQHSLTHRVFQELVLGSRVFESFYRLPPVLQVESYLSQYDQPLLAPSMLGALRTWLQPADHYAAIFTNRPSRSVDGFFSTPEAEIGAQAAGVGTLPIMGLGPLSWLAVQRGLDKETFIKPSPLHVLAAIWLAVHAEEGPQEEGVEQATQALWAALGLLEGRGDAGWSGLVNTRVYVFEDSVRGLQSARAAQKTLAENGISLHFVLSGVSDRLLKQQSLRDFGAQVFPGLPAALQRLDILPTG